MISATVNLARTALSQSDERSYFILISGQDFPIKSNAYIHDFLNAGFGVEYIQNEPLPRKAWKLNGGLDRVNYKWFIDELGLKESHQSYLTQIQNKSLRKYDFIPYGGSQWWCLTANCIKFILNLIQHDSLNTYHFFENSFIPDELFFQTAIMNSRFSAYVKNNNYRFINWTDGPNYPKIFTSQDYDQIMSSEKLFARKFDLSLDAEIIDRISREI